MVVGQCLELQPAEVECVNVASRRRQLPRLGLVHHAKAAEVDEGPGITIASRKIEGDFSFMIKIT